MPASFPIGQHSFKISKPPIDPTLPALRRKLPQVNIPEHIIRIVRNKIVSEKIHREEIEPQQKQTKKKINRSRSSTTLRQRTRKFYLSRSLSATGYGSSDISSENEGPPIMTNDYKLTDNDREFILNIDLKNSRVPGVNNVQIYRNSGMSLDSCIDTKIDAAQPEIPEITETNVSNLNKKDSVYHIPIEEVSDLDAKSDILDHIIQQLSVDRSPSEAVSKAVHPGSGRILPDIIKPMEVSLDPKNHRMRNHFFISEGRMIDISYDSDSGWVSKGSNMCLNFDRLQITKSDRKLYDSIERDDNKSLDSSFEGREQCDYCDEEKATRRSLGKTSSQSLDDSGRSEKGSQNLSVKQSRLYGYDSECSGAETEIHMSSFENRSVDIPSSSQYCEMKKKTPEKSKGFQNKSNPSFEEIQNDSPNFYPNSQSQNRNTQKYLCEQTSAGGLSCVNPIKSIIEEVRNEFVEKQIRERKKTLSLDLTSSYENMCLADEAMKNDKGLNLKLTRKGQHHDDSPRNTGKQETTENKNHEGETLKNEKCITRRDDSNDSDSINMFLKCNSPRNSVIPDQEQSVDNDADQKSVHRKSRSRHSQRSLDKGSVEEFSDDVFMTNDELFAKTKRFTNRRQSLSTGDIPDHNVPDKKLNSFDLTSSMGSIQTADGDDNKRISSVSINEKPEYFEYNSSQSSMCDLPPKKKERLPSIIKKSKVKVPPNGNTNPEAGSSYAASTRGKARRSSNNIANDSVALSPQPASPDHARRPSSGLPQLKTLQSLAAANSPGRKTPTTSTSSTKTTKTTGKKTSIKRTNSAKKPNAKKLTAPTKSPAKSSVKKTTHGSKQNIKSDVASSEYRDGGSHSESGERPERSQRDRRDGHRSQFTRSLSNADVPPEDKTGMLAIH